MFFRINSNIIETPLIDILKTIHREIPNKLGSIIDHGTSIGITCPVHKDGQEKKPSCYICNDPEKPELYGYTHCFACGFCGSFIKFIAECFSKDEEFAKEWLCARFGKLENSKKILPKIELNIKNINNSLDESILDSFESYHPYMTKRKLTKPIIEKFKIKYDSTTSSIVFPVWDEHGELVLLTRRNITNKFFHIDKNRNKPVYLLNEIIKENISTVYVCESQINALTLWGWGYPAIALLGTGSKNQYDILNKSGIRNYILCFDGDYAGYKGQERFIKNISKESFISIKEIPKNKDVNDLEKDEFEKLNLYNI